MKRKILILIDDYLSQTERAIRLFNDILKHDDLLRYVKQKKFPQKGFIGGAKYSFHGVGCSVDFGDCIVDFDFGPKGRIGGFDAWRLYCFAKQLPEKYSHLQNLKMIEIELSKLHRLGVVKCPKWQPSPHLYYKIEDLS